jgi:hypothetical protein
MKAEFVERLSKVTNRSRGQTLFLLDLLDNDVFKLLELEEKLRNNSLFYCPGNRESCEEVLAMENEGSYRLDFELLG